MSSSAGASKDANLPVDFLAMATVDKKCDFKPMRFQRRAVGDYDVLVDMKYNGICHTDLHIAAGDLSIMGAHYPCVPGHELAGVAIQVGQKVTKIKVGDQVGIGCMVDSCLQCAACKRGEEQMCSGQIATYGGIDKHGRARSGPNGPKHTLGGYSTKHVVHEHFAVKIPSTYPLEMAGPVMCAGVTLFDPLRRYGATKGTRVGIVGLGGLGQMGAKIAKALGCIVTTITSSEKKRDFCTRIGADRVIVSSNGAEMKAASKSLDLILNTIPVEHDFNVYASLLAPGGKQIILGLNSALIGGMVVNGMTCGASKVKGSGIGGIEATQAVIDLCDAHKIFPETKVIGVAEINHVYELLSSGNDAGIRYVIDIANTLNEGAFEKCKNVKAPVLQPSKPLSLGLITGTICNILCCCKW